MGETFGEAVVLSAAPNSSIPRTSAVAADAWEFILGKAKVVTVTANRGIGCAQLRSTVRMGSPCLPVFSFNFQYHSAAR
jgi:hypothetical protein